MNISNVEIPCLSYSLAADWYDAGKTDHILLAYMGYVSSKERNRDFLLALGEKADMSILAVDLSGHGESPFVIDETSPAQHVLETVAVFDWLQKKYPEAKIAVIGTSYGGFLAAYLSKYRDFGKLILRTPAIYLPSDLYMLQSDIDRDYTSKVYRKDQKLVANHPLFKQPNVFTGSTLVVTHELDEDIPKETSNVYKAAYKADEYLVPGFKHSMRDAQNPQEVLVPYQDTIANWLIR